MVTYAKISPKSGEPQRYSWGTQKKKKKKSTRLTERQTTYTDKQTTTGRLTGGITSTHTEPNSLLGRAHSRPPTYRKRFLAATSDRCTTKMSLVSPSSSTCKSSTETCKHFLNHEHNVLTQFVPQTRLSRFWRVVASARRRETFVRDGYLRFCVPAVEWESPS